MSATGALPIWITILQKGGRLSDIEFLAIKEFGNKLKTNTGEQLDGGTGNAAELTASSGKDLYLAKASILVTQDAITASVLADVDLIADTTVVDTIKVEAIGTSSIGPWGPQTRRYDFIVQGVKVAATKVIKIDVISSDADLDIIGTLVCFEEDTGASPQV